MFAQMNINEVEDTVDDLADYMEDMNEVNDILGRSYNVGEEIDEDDLDAGRLTGIKHTSRRLQRAAAASAAHALPVITVHRSESPSSCTQAQSFGCNAS